MLVFLLAFFLVYINYPDAYWFPLTHSVLNWVIFMESLIFNYLS